MKLAIDVRHQSSGFGTGGARVLDNLIRAFEACHTDTQLVRYNKFQHSFWISNKAGRALAPILADVFMKNFMLPAWAHVQRPDVMLYALPPISFTIKSIPQITYILDVPLKTEERTLSTFIYNDIYIKQSCLHADMLLTISKNAGEHIMREYNVPKTKIRTASLCVDLDYIRRTPPCLPLPERDGFFLGILSRICWRKNPSAYLEVFRRLPKQIRSRYPLLLAGAVRSLDDLSFFTDEKIIHDVKDDVICLGRLSDDELIGYIKRAEALLFPSRYEGFGLPILESIACGTPVVASDIDVFKELFRDVASLHNPDDHEGMADALTSVIEGAGMQIDENLRSKWLDQYSFNAYIKRISACINEVI